MKRYIYHIRELELWELLAQKPVPLEVLERKGDALLVAFYEPLRDLEPDRVEEVPQDWRNWREGFGPVEVGSFVILPPWKVPVLINPGNAFGTGLHPSTRLCIRLMELYIAEGDSVLDVGTGTGILAIVAKRLRAGRVLGIDVSEDAVSSCKENAKLNGVEVDCRLATPSEVKERFDLLVANLDLPLFREEMDNLMGLFRKVAVFSGIYGKEELEEFLIMLLRRGLSADRILGEEGWFGVGVRNEEA